MDGPVDMIVSAHTRTGHGLCSQVIIKPYCARIG